MNTASIVVLSLIVGIVGMACLGGSWPLAIGAPFGIAIADLVGGLLGLFVGLIGAAVGLFVAAIALVVSLLIALLVSLPFILLLALPLIAVLAIVYYAGKSSNGQTSAS
jgi:hypothetical protein